MAALRDDDGRSEPNPSGSSRARARVPGWDGAASVGVALLGLASFPLVGFGLVVRWLEPYTFVVLSMLALLLFGAGMLSLTSAEVTARREDRAGSDDFLTRH